MKNKVSLLGVLGGLGPMSTVYFCELLTAHTRAQSDADHIDMLVSSRASTPDRTAFILGKSTQDPLPVMQEECARLARAGVDLVVIPCNTAHYFYNGLQASTSLPMLNIIEETVRYLKRLGVKTFGLLATEGTVSAGAYQEICHREGLVCLVPDASAQHTISSIIYNQIKANKPIDRAAFDCVAEALLQQGCERLVLGCTELSLLKKQGLDDRIFVDSLEVLAHQTILACGKVPIGFPASFETEDPI